MTNVIISASRGSDRSEQEVSILTADLFLTRCIRRGENQARDAAPLPADDLAMWLAHNWWRLRHEARGSEKTNPTWASAHRLTSVGSGYHWPNVTIWGEGERVRLLSTADPVNGFGPLRYFTDALLYVDARAFETSVDAFVDQCITSRRGTNALRTVWRQVAEERSDPEMTQWRKFEALAGFDPDEAPEGLMSGLAELIREHGQDDTEEVVAAAPGESAIATFEAVLDRIETSRTTLHLTNIAGHGALDLGDRTYDPPWRKAEATAKSVRKVIDLDEGAPLASVQLAEICGAARSVVWNSERQGNADVPYGLRWRKNGQDRVVFHSRHPTSRRFELARLLGDAIWSHDATVGPASRAFTPRQQFQRAFAANLLCPYPALRDYLGPSWTREDIADAARHFRVSELLVKTMLVNKRQMERNALDLGRGTPETADLNTILEPDVVEAA
jgi:hypothetical protein